MSPKERFIASLKENEHKFSPSDRKIAEYLIHAYPAAMLETATSISEKLGLSVATITRFFPKAGLANIRASQDSTKNDIDFLRNSPLDRFYQRGDDPNATKDLFDKAWGLDLSNLQQTYQGISKLQVKSFIKLVSDSHRTIYIIGERKAFALSFYMYVQLHALHPNVVHVRTNQSLIADIIVNIGPNDVLIVFDFRRYAKVNINLAELFKSIGGKIIVISDSAFSPSAKLADVLFIMENKGVSIFDSYTAGFTLVNSLLAEVTQRSGNYVRERYEKLETYYRQLDIFSSQQVNTNIRKLIGGGRTRRERK